MNDHELKHTDPGSLLLNMQKLARWRNRRTFASAICSRSPADGSAAACSDFLSRRLAGRRLECIFSRSHRAPSLQIEASTGSMGIRADASGLSLWQIFQTFVPASEFLTSRFGETAKRLLAKGVEAIMRILTALWIASMLLVTSCSRDEVSKIEATGKDNSNLEHAIRTRLASDAQVQDAALTITANAEKSEVVLSGSVPSEESRGRAVELTKNVQPGLVVIDQIEVRPAEAARGEYTEIMAKRAREKALLLGDHIGSSLDDAWIYTKVVTKLAAQQGTPATKINVDVTDSVVTLRGQVDSEARKMEAEHVVEETSGVKRVNNLLLVRGG